MKRSSNARGTLIISVSCGDVEKWRCSHKCRRTKAIASENVGRVLSYQAALRTHVTPFSISRCAVVYLSFADNYRRLTQRLLEEQKGLEERVFMAPQRPSHPC